jgi:glycosyltransferase involved in cell wall biosynthesis
MSRSISVILPIYNEAENIADVIKRILNWLPSVTEDFEIVAVDDGSSDKSKDILEDLAKQDFHLRVIRHLRNKGYGAALTTGFMNAKKEYLLMMDADQQFDISELIKLIPYIPDYDIVAGFRLKRMDSFYRCLLGATFNFSMNIFFGLNLKDINCGFKLYKKSLLEKMKLITQGALINVEMMAFAKKSMVKIKEVGINHLPRIYGKQTGSSLKVIVKAVFEVIKVKIRLLRRSKTSLIS